MSTSPLEVKVIYDASRATRKRAVAPRSMQSRVSGPSKLRTALPFLNLAIALAAYYFTWWKADSFIYMRMMLATPIPVSTTFFTAKTVLQEETERAVRAVEAADGEQPQSEAPPASGAFRRPTPDLLPSKNAIIISATAYIWLGVVTAAACALALSAGAGFGGMSPSGSGRVGFILTMGVVLGITYWVLAVFMEVGTAYKPSHLRWFILGPVALCATIGVIKHPRFKLFTTLAGVLIIVAGLATTAGLWLWKSAGAIEPQYATAGVLVAAFVAVSLWGWLLLPISRRLA